MMVCCRFANHLERLSEMIEDPWLILDLKENKDVNNIRFSCNHEANNEPGFNGIRKVEVDVIVLLINKRRLLSIIEYIVHFIKIYAKLFTSA